MNAPFRDPIETDMEHVIEELASSRGRILVVGRTLSDSEIAQSERYEKAAALVRQALEVVRSGAPAP